MVKRATAWETDVSQRQSSDHQRNPLLSTLSYPSRTPYRLVLSTLSHTHSILKFPTTHWGIFQPHFIDEKIKPSRKHVQFPTAVMQSQCSDPDPQAPNQRAFHFPVAVYSGHFRSSFFLHMFQHVLMGNYPTTCQFSGSSQITPLLPVLSCPSRLVLHPNLFCFP